MELFNVGEGGRLVIRPEMLVVGEFAAIWQADSSPHKERAIRLLTFVFFMCDYKSPYRAYAYEVRATKLIHDVIREKAWEITPEVVAAMDKFDELQQTPSMGLLKDAQEAVLKIRSFFKEVDIASDTRGTKIAMLTKLLSSTGDIIKGLSMLQQKVEQEVLTAGKMRGGGTLGHREMPKERRTRLDAGVSQKEVADE